MVGLVHDHEVPRLGVEQPLAGAAVVTTQRVKRCHDLRRRIPESPASRVRLGNVALQADVEHVLQPNLPLRHELGRREDQKPAHTPGSYQRHQHQAAFDGLAEPDVVRHQPPERPRPVHRPAHPQLMRQQSHPRAREDSPLIVDGCDGQRLRPHERIDRSVERSVTKRRLERRRGDEFTGGNLLQLAAESDDDRGAHVGDDASGAVACVADRRAGI